MKEKLFSMVDPMVACIRSHYMHNPLAYNLRLMILYNYTVLLCGHRTPKDTPTVSVGTSADSLKAKPTRSEDTKENVLPYNKL